MRYMMIVVLGVQAIRLGAAQPIMEEGLTHSPMPVRHAAESGEEGSAEPVFGAPQGEDRLKFVNRDRMHGRLSEASLETSALTWQHTASKEALMFQLDRLANIKLAPRSITREWTSDAVVHLRNGDILPCRILAMHDEELQVESRYGGVLHVKRSMVLRIIPKLVNSDVLFEGPNSLEEWTFDSHPQNRRSWRYSDGVLYAEHQRPIGRMIERLSDKYKVQFDAAWVGEHPRFAFFFNSTDVLRNQEAHMLNVQGLTVRAVRAIQNRGTRIIGSRITHEGFGGDARSARFQLFVDRVNRNFTLLIDGTRAGQWTDPLELADGMKGIAFRSHNLADTLISNIRVVQWDGQLPDETEEVETRREDDMIRFANGDAFAGRVLSIRDDSVQFQTEYATVDVPFDRIVDITMAGEKDERVRHDRNEIRVSLMERGRLTLELEQIADDILHGKSDSFGSISLPLGLLRSIDFNLYHDAEEGASGPF